MIIYCLGNIELSITKVMIQPSNEMASCGAWHGIKVWEAAPEVTPSCFPGSRFQKDRLRFLKFPNSRPAEDGIDPPTTLALRDQI
jgi:hypothetical protein